MTSKYSYKKASDNNSDKAFVTANQYALHESA